MITNIDESIDLMIHILDRIEKETMTTKTTMTMKLITTGNHRQETRKVAEDAVVHDPYL